MTRTRRQAISPYVARGSETSIQSIQKRPPVVYRMNSATDRSSGATDVQRAAPSNCYGNRNRQQPLRRCQEVIASEQAINRLSDAGTGIPSEQGINGEVSARASEAIGAIDG